MELVSGGELLDALDALGLLKYSQAAVSASAGLPAEIWRSAVVVLTARKACRGRLRSKTEPPVTGLVLHWLHRPGS